MSHTRNRDYRMTAEEELADDRIIAFSQSNGNGQLIEILQIPDLDRIIIAYCGTSHPVVAFINAIITVWHEESTRTSRDESVFRLLLRCALSFRPCGSIRGILNVTIHGGIWSETVARIVHIFATQYLGMSVAMPRVLLGKSYDHVTGSGTWLGTTAHRWYPFTFPQRWTMIGQTDVAQEDLERMIRDCRMRRGHT
jgi:hypothetical protein